MEFVESSSLSQQRDVRDLLFGLARQENARHAGYFAKRTDERREGGDISAHQNLPTPHRQLPHEILIQALVAINTILNPRPTSRVSVCVCGGGGFIHSLPRPFDH